MKFVHPPEWPGYHLKDPAEVKEQSTDALSGCIHFREGVKHADRENLNEIKDTSHIHTRTNGHHEQTRELHLYIMIK